MPAIVMLMLAVQAAMFLVTILTVLVAAKGRKPAWSSLALPLIMIGAISWEIADHHPGAGIGSELLAYFSPLLLGMGIMTCLIMIRERRGLDTAP